MPRVVAEWQAERTNADLEKRRTQVPEEAAGVASFNELRTLSLDELALRWLRMYDMRHIFRAGLRERECPSIEASDSLPAILPQRVLGAVAEGDSAAFVLVEAVLSPDEETGRPRRDQPRVLTARRRRGRWLLDPSSMIFSEGVMSVQWSECPAK
jgi:hypothetical protein